MRRVALAALVALAAGCGGGDDGPLSREEFQQRANAICADLAKDLGDVGQPESSQEFVTQLEQGQRRLRTALRELGELEPPEQYEQDFQRLLEQGDQAVSTINEMIAAGEAQDVEEFTKLAERAEKEDAESDRIARRIGLDDCATA